MLNAMITSISSRSRKFSSSSNIPPNLQHWIDKGWIFTPPVPVSSQTISLKALDHNPPCPELPSAISWARRRTSIPNSLLHKLFRQRRIKIWDPQVDHVKKVSPSSLLPVNARLLIPPREQLSKDDIRHTAESRYQRRHHDGTQNKYLIDALYPKSILYTSPSFIAINKPAGIPVQGGTLVSTSIDSILPQLSFLITSSSKQNTKIHDELDDDEKIAAAAAAGGGGGADISGGGSSKTYTTLSSSDSNSMLKLVHRIDKDVSGVLLLARGPDAATSLIRAMSQSSLKSQSRIKQHDTVYVYDELLIKKKYWAIIVSSKAFRNHKKNGNISSPIYIHQHSEHSALQKPKHALTKYTVLATSVISTLGEENEINSSMRKKFNTVYLNWVELQPMTGRKHQLRIHCSHELSSPILGDSRYGNTRDEPQKSIVARLKQQLGDKGRYRADSIIQQEDMLSSNDRGTPLFLHCHQITLVQKRKDKKKESITIDAPLPDIWKVFFEMQGWKLPE